MGEASAAAQNLKNPITSGAKMMAAEGQTVYMLVDRAAGGGQGAVIGMLKVGRKKLFLLDGAGKPNEMSPMCVLDFYVTEKRQRTGCGKKLFETMLRREEVEPRYLAVDRPSEKLISFLRKHYGLANIIPQVYILIQGNRLHIMMIHVLGEQLCHFFWIFQRPAPVSDGFSPKEGEDLHGKVTICVTIFNNLNFTRIIFTSVTKSQLSYH